MQQTLTNNRDARCSLTDVLSQDRTIRLFPAQTDQTPPCPVPDSRAESFAVTEEIGRGASCIVYQCERIDAGNVRVPGRLKEFYPDTPPIGGRDNMGSAELCIDWTDRKLHSFAQTFMQQPEKFSAFRRLRAENSAGDTQICLNNYFPEDYKLYCGNGTMYIFESFRDGESVDKIAASLKPQDKLNIAYETALFLRALHLNGWLHLDVKPSNIQKATSLNTDQTILCFFDIDSFIECAPGDRAKPKSYSDGFCAPEQNRKIMGERVCADHRTDQYGCGMLLLYLLDPDVLNKKTFRTIRQKSDLTVDKCTADEENAKLIQRICKTQFRDNERIKDNAAKFLTRCLRQNRLDRFPTDDDFVKSALLLRDETDVTEDNLRNGAQYWKEIHPRAKATLSDHSILPELLPSVDTKKSFPIFVSSDEQHENKQPLSDAVGENSALLIGQGGIGKTFTLYRFMQEGIVNGKTPLFISLASAPEFEQGNVYKNGSSYIRRCVYRYLNQKKSLSYIYGLSAEVAVDPVASLLTATGKFVLLLDGVNELSRADIPGVGNVYSLVMQEINHLIQQGVQVILTSQTDEPKVFGDVKRLHLAGLDAETIREYLGTHGANWDEVRQNKSLTDTLCIPLFLILYAKLRDRSGVCTQGEILKKYFSEFQNDLKDYTVQNHLAEIENERGSAAKITHVMQTFMLDVILPEIAYTMEQAGRSEIYEDEVLPILQNVLTKRGDCDVCGHYADMAFQKYRDLDTNLSCTADQWIRLYAGSDGKISAEILSCARSLGVLRDVGQGAYSFSHQYVRDYFAAVKHINTLRLSVYLNERSKNDLARRCMRAVFRDAPVHLPVRRMIGECLGEHLNAPYCADGMWHYGVPEGSGDRTLLRQSLDLYRGCFNTEAEDGYALYSLLQILKEVRQDLSGADFSGLDLKQLRLNGTRLSRGTLTAKFKDSDVTPATFLPDGHAGGVIDIQFSPDGKILASASADGTVRLWDVKTCQTIGVLTGHKAAVNTVRFSADGKSVLTSSDDRTARLWNVSSLHGRIVFRSKKSALISASFHPDGQSIVLASMDGKVWRKTIGSPAKKVFTLPESLSLVCVSADGSMVLAEESDRTLVLWDTVAAREIGSLRTRAINALFSADGKRIAAKTRNHTVIIWNTESLDEIGTLCGHQDYINAVCFSLDSKRIATSSRDKTIKIWDAETCNEIETLTAHEDKSPHHIAFSPDNKTLAASLYESIRLWDTAAMQTTGVMKGALSAINCIRFDPKRNSFATASDDGMINLWSVPSLRKTAVIRSSAGTPLTVCYSPDGSFLASGSYGDIQLWNAATYEAIGRLPRHPVGESTIAFSPDNQMMVTTSSFDTSVMLWDLASLRENNSFTSNTCKEEITIPSPVRTICFSPDGKNLLVLACVGNAKIWDVASHGFKGELQMGYDLPLHACFDPKGEKIMVITLNGGQIWDAATYKKIQTFDIKFIRNVAFAGFSPDGKKVIWVSRVSYKHQSLLKRFSTRLKRFLPKKWRRFNNYKPDCYLFNKLSLDLENRNVVQKDLRLRYTIKDIPRATDSPDGRLIAAASKKGVIQIWDMDKQKLLGSIQYIPGLMANDCDLRRLHTRLKLSEKEKETFRQNGLIV